MNVFWKWQVLLEICSRFYPSKLSIKILLLKVRESQCLSGNPIGIWFWFPVMWLKTKLYLSTLWVVDKCTESGFICTQSRGMFINILSNITPTKQIHFLVTMCRSHLVMVNFADYRWLNYWMVLFKWNVLFFKFCNSFQILETPIPGNSCIQSAYFFFLLTQFCQLLYHAHDNLKIILGFYSNL